MSKKPATSAHAQIGAELFKIKALAAEIKIRAERVSKAVAQAADESVADNDTYDNDQGRAQLMIAGLANTYARYQTTHSHLQKQAGKYYELPTAKQLAAVDTTIITTKGGGGGGR